MFCKNCGKEIDNKAVVCVHCGVSLKVKKPIFKRWWFWVLIVFLFIGAISSTGGSDSGSTGGDNAGSVQNQTEPQIPAEFADACPVEVSASISDNIIGVPELSCHITNNTDKEIAAIQFYFFPKDVYGDDVNTIFTTNKLQTDTPIAPQGSCTRGWQLLDQEVKSGELYVYSVYFTDGSEWGDKDASLTKIKKYGVKLSVEG